MEQKLPATGGGGDWFSTPDPNAIDAWLMNFLHILQKYGVLCTAVCCLMFYFFYRLAKIRKNLVVAKFWMTTSWGMVFLTILFIILPYFVLVFYQSNS
ncbi:hypothetical protein SAMN04487897_109147 [Paenibacillus sp. yr247]|uniref:hypothetical protein n=1 Tax=Paenibacillus sp. yr247 TaxID=1761880 RepID=UPI00088F0077|nr:hypothetical protein [Paenibacillus sp. yr247]SDO18733.1 hypothetical protein SAMN04487897_109147 [Paenibacillus sp. yr247]